MSSINSISSLIAINSLNTNRQATGLSLERLATGNAINRASDNPAGLIASENFKSRLSVISAGMTSSERSVASLNIRDGQLGAALDNIGDLDSLVVQSANTGGFIGSELGAIQTQISGAITGINRAVSDAGIDLSDVTAEMVVGTDEATGDPIYETVSLNDLARVVDIDPAAAQQLVDGARSAVVQARAEAGIEARAAESERRVLEEEQINIARANSSIRDTDYAKETSNAIRTQILEQASIYTLKASLKSEELVLGLLDITA